MASPVLFIDKSNLLRNCRRWNWSRQPGRRDVVLVRTPTSPAGEEICAAYHDQPKVEVVVTVMREATPASSEFEIVKMRAVGESN